MISENKTKETSMNKKINEWVPLAKWNQHFQYPTQGTMRNICPRRRDNGAKDFLSMINGRFYVNVERFNQWMKEQYYWGMQ